jgi:hypothetical protein
VAYDATGDRQAAVVVVVADVGVVVDDGVVVAVAVVVDVVGVVARLVQAMATI